MASHLPPGNSDIPLEMTDNGAGLPLDYLPLSDEEDRILELWDQLQELRLEIAIINAQNRLSHADATEDITDGDAKAAQAALVEARARYMLRNQVIEAVMIANPVLKAVHNGVDASPVERDLLPHIEERDQNSIAVAKQVTKIGNVRQELSRVQSKTFTVSRENVILTSQLLDLVDDMKQIKPNKSTNPAVQEEMEQAERNLASSRRRWRVVKGLASGVVVGSGINWAANPELEDVVLDPEDEELGAAG